MKHFKLLSVLIVISLALAFSLTNVQEAQAQPSNDDFDSATDISVLPFSDSVDTTQATVADDDPPVCSYTWGYTVWYRFSPASNGYFTMDTIGSDYDTVMSVYTGLRGTLNNIACQTEGRYPMSVRLYAGEVYYILIGALTDASQGGSLVFNFTEIAGPVNDDFDQSKLIAGLPYSDSEDTSLATWASDDPTECYHNSGSVWYSFTAPYDMLLEANTLGSSYDTTLAVYTGSRGSLSLVEGCCNDDHYGVQSKAEFYASAGVTYHFLVGRCCESGGDGGGLLTLNLFEKAPPRNDNFSNAEVIGGFPFETQTNNELATVETGEPATGCASYGLFRTFWYQFTAPDSGRLLLKTSGFYYQVKSVYEGVNLDALTPIGCSSYQDQLVFEVEGGLSYYIQLGSLYEWDYGTYGFSLDWVPVPVNDNLANAILIESLPYYHTSSNEFASREPDEPVSICAPAEYFNRTVWYKYVPAEDGALRLNTPDGFYYLYKAIYEEVAPGQLTEVGCRSFGHESLWQQVEKDKTYYIQLGSFYDFAYGTYTLEVLWTPPPVNDNFANAESIESIPSNQSGTNEYASTEPGEPYASCANYNIQQRSVWFKYQPSESGSIMFQTWGFSANFLAAYSGISINTLTEVGCRRYSTPLVVQVEAGNTYYFQLGSMYEWDFGNYTLDIIYTPPPMADFVWNPSLPNIYTECVAFQDRSYDPGNLGIQISTWEFGDGTSATGWSVCHNFRQDGDYAVLHYVETPDGRSASVTKTVSIRTHDISITRFDVPAAASVGQMRTIKVGIRNNRYPEKVIVQLWKGGLYGQVFVGETTIEVPVSKRNRTTDFLFTYTFTEQDGIAGKVNFFAIAQISPLDGQPYDDAYTSDNVAVSTPTKINANNKPSTYSTSMAAPSNTKGILATAGLLGAGLLATIALVYGSPLKWLVRKE